MDIMKMLKYSLNVFSLLSLNDAAICATKNGHVEIVKTLIKHGADPTICAQFVTSEHAELFKVLINAGANQQVCMCHASACMHHAAAFNMISSVQLLLDIGVHPSEGIYYAADNRNNTIVEVLLERGANDANSLEQGIQCAASNNYGDTVKIFLEWGADPRSCNVHPADDDINDVIREYYQDTTNLLYGIRCNW